MFDPTIILQGAQSGFGNVFGLSNDDKQKADYINQVTEAVRNATAQGISISNGSEPVQDPGILEKYGIYIAAFVLILLMKK